MVILHIRYPCNPIQGRKTVPRSTTIVDSIFRHLLLNIYNYYYIILNM